MKYLQDITQEQIKEIFYYNPETGIFTRKKWKKGSVAGGLDPNGCIRIRIGKKCYLAHRLAWVYFYGYWPDCEIDHKNMVRNDNRINNLRLASHSENQCNQKAFKNNKLGIKGVFFHKASKKYAATIQKDKKQVHIGLFETASAAQKARMNAAEKLHGGFVNHG